MKARALLQNANINSGVYLIVPNVGNTSADKNLLRTLWKLPLQKIYKTGRSPATRLPGECRFDAEEVDVSEVGDWVILESLKSEAAMPKEVLDSLSYRIFMPEGGVQSPMVEEKAVF